MEEEGQIQENGEPPKVDDKCLKFEVILWGLQNMILFCFPLFR